MYAVVQPADLAWHIPSHRCDPSVSEQLRAVLEHCHTVVSVHGFGRADFWMSVLVGGGDRVLAAELARCLRRSLPDYDIVDDVDAIPDGMRGVAARNPVNQARGGGVQLELPPRVRGLGPHWTEFDGDGFTPHTEALIDALVAFAESRTGA